MIAHQTSDRSGWQEKAAELGPGGFV